MTDIKIPDDLWDGDGEGVITAWLMNDGEAVSTETVVADIMTEKIQHELTSPAEGILSILVEAEVPVSKGQVVGKIIGQ